MTKEIQANSIASFIRANSIASFNFKLAEALRIGTPLDYRFHVSSVLLDFSRDMLSFDSAISYIDSWRITPQFLCFENMISNASKHYHYSLCSKRGNAVYRWRVNLKFKGFVSSLESFDKVSLVVNGSHGNCCRMLMLVATVDPSKYNLREYNLKQCSHFIELFRKRINRLFPGVRIARTFESFKNPYKGSRGYLHVNFVLLLPRSIRVFHYHSKKSKVSTWRLVDRNELDSIKHCWVPGFVDVQAVANGHSLLEYCFKYITKYFFKESCVSDQRFNNSVLTLFRKRSYSLPMSFCSAILGYMGSLVPRLDNVLHNSAELSKILLNGDANYRLVGIFSGEELDFDDSLWIRNSSDPPPNSARVDFYNADMVLPERDIIELCVHDVGWRMPVYIKSMASRFSAFEFTTLEDF